MSSPVRSVAVRLSMDPSAYISGAARAATATTALDREVSKVGGTATTSMERAASGMGSAESAMGKLNQSAGALGFTLGGLAGVGSAVAVGMSVKWAGDYQSALTKLATTAGESQQNLSMVGRGMLDMAGQVGIGADELAKGMYTVESGGFHASDALLVLKSSAQGARQENADLGKVTDAVTTILHDYHLNASDAATVTSQLITAVSHGKTTFDELTGSLHSVTPLASRLNISIADVTGTLSAMTASGMSADQATQNMENTLTHLAGPTSTMTAELAQLGISTDDLAKSLSTRGLAGTLQYVEEAIVNHLDPATKRVLLPALNQSKTAVADLNIMIGNMPPALAKASQSLLDGTTSQGDYRKAAQALGGQAGVMGDQFLSLYKSSDGFNGVLKQGGPAAQVFTAAMQKAFGTTAALNVALNTTGENAAATNAAIKDIAGSSAQADGSIKGWSEVQGNFNQQLAQAEAHAKSLAIEAGQHLLPALTGVLGWVNSTGIPAIEGLGSAVGGAVHWFSELPGPVKDVAFALAALRIADMIGVFDKLGGAVGGLRSAFQGFREEMQLQQTLLNMEQAAGNTEAAFGRLGSAGTVAMGKLKAGASSVLDMFGGPWGAALAGAVGAVALYEHGIQQAADTEKKWVDALKQGGAAMEQAQSDMAKTAAQEKSLDDGFAGFAATVSGVRNNIKQMTPDVDAASKSYQDWYNGLGLVDQKSQDLQQATAHLNDVLKTHSADSLAAKEAENAVQRAQEDQRVATDELNQSTKTSIQLSQDQANALLALTGSSLAVKQSYDEFQSSYQQLLSDQAKGQTSTAQLTTEQDALNQSALNVATSAGTAGAAWAKANGVTDTATASQYAQLLALQKVADAMGTNTPASIRTLIGSLQASVAQGHLTAAQMDGVTAAVDGIPGQKNVNVTADTSQAQQQINGLLGMYNHVTYSGSAILVNGRVVANADGNLLKAYATGGMSPMSSSVAQVVQPGTLRVIGDNPVADEAFIPINNSARSLSILAETASRMGLGLTAMADGGITDRFWAQASPAMLNTIRALVSPAASTAPGAPSAPSGNAALAQRMGAALGWGSGAQWNAWYALGQRESGWRNTAQNPTSTAYGIPQFLNSTWATVGLQKTSDAATQILGMERYIQQRYRDPIGAWAHETKFGWYHNGGTVTGPDGATVPAFLKVGETVRTTEQEDRVQRVLQTQEVAGTSRGGNSGPANVTINARVFVGDQEITDIARVEAEAVLGEALTGMASTARAGVRS